MAISVFAQVCHARVVIQVDAFSFLSLQPVLSHEKSRQGIPAPFTSRRSYNPDKAAALMRLLRNRQYVRNLGAEERMSSSASEAASLNHSRGSKCRNSGKHGIV